MPDFEFKAPSERRANIQRIVTIVICALLIIILIWAIVRHFQKSTDEEPAKLPDTSQNDTDTADQGSSQGNSTPSAPTDNGGSSDDQAAADDSKKPAGDQPAQLSDTGPGDVAAIFVGATIIGGAAYQLYVRRRLTHES
jgi:cytoskeletal protein RodZ